MFLSNFRMAQKSTNFKSSKNSSRLLTEFFSFKNWYLLSNPRLVEAEAVSPSFDRQLTAERCLAKLLSCTKSSSSMQLVVVVSRKYCSQKLEVTQAMTFSKNGLTANSFQLKQCNHTVSQRVIAILYERPNLLTQSWQLHVNDGLAFHTLLCSFKCFSIFLIGFV